MTLRRKTIEKPHGRGRIRMTDRTAIMVRYALVIQQVVDDEADTGQLAGHIEIRGSIDVGPGEGIVDLGGKYFTLETSDGRCLKASALKGDPVSRQWDIAAIAPGIGLGPC